MDSLLKSCALLLTYPDEALIDGLDEVSDAIYDAKATRCDKPDSQDALDAFDALEGFVAWLRVTPLLDVQSDYVATFDLGKDASLNLFEHLHGDSRDRGSAMLELLSLYREHGLALESEELPDYLPVFLEFLSGIESDDAQIWLESIAHLIEQIDAQLQYRDSPWSAITWTLLALAGHARPTAAEPPLGDMLPTVDADYYDSPITFGGCPSDCASRL